MKLNLAIFGSGEGTNAANICEFFKDYVDLEIKLILTNKENAGILKKVRRYGIETVVFNEEQFNKEYVYDLLLKNDIHLCILAGFLWKVPKKLLDKWLFINIHPAILPNYAGLYGDSIHKTVKENGDKKTGITIHLCNDEYDKGKIIFQQKCAIFPEDSWEDIKNKVRELELLYYPIVIDKFLRSIFTSKK
jgi:phosphoribosylglycinamide formyltransferase-1